MFENVSSLMKLSTFCLLKAIFWRRDQRLHIEDHLPSNLALSIYTWVFQLLLLVLQFELINKTSTN